MFSKRYRKTNHITTLLYTFWCLTIFSLCVDGVNIVFMNNIPATKNDSFPLIQNEKKKQYLKTCAVNTV